MRFEVRNAHRGATPKDMNNIPPIIRRMCNTFTYKFGISILHFYLRCFEFLLHISYKLELEKWAARGKDAQDNVKKRNNKITSKFYEEMGLGA